MTRGRPSAVSNALEILEVVAARGLGVRAKEIAAALRMPPATAYRVLNQLVEDEYLARTSDLRGFALGARLEGLIAAATTPPLSTAAREQLDQLRSAIRFAVHILIYRSGSVRILSSDPDHPVHAVHDLSRYVHASAAGKLFLANIPDWKQALPPTPLHSITPVTVTNLALLKDELELARQRQLAIQIDQLERGRSCLALPIRNIAGGVVATLCISGPSERVEAMLAHSDTARECACRLSPLLS